MAEQAYTYTREYYSGLVEEVSLEDLRFYLAGSYVDVDMTIDYLHETGTIRAMTAWYHCSPVSKEESNEHDGTI